MSLEDDARALIRRSRRHERRARMTIDGLCEQGPPVRLRDLCAVTGFSKMKFFAAIDSGDLDITWVKTGQTKMAIIDREEARRYLASIGFAA